MRWHVVRFDGSQLAYSDHSVVLGPMNVERTQPSSQQVLGPLTFAVVVPQNSFAGTYTSTLTISVVSGP
jgi:hypothetical protein